MKNLDMQETYLQALLQVLRARLHPLRQECQLCRLLTLQVG